MSMSYITERDLRLIPSPGSEFYDRDGDPQRLPALNHHANYATPGQAASLPGSRLMAPPKGFRELRFKWFGTDRNGGISSRKTGAGVDMTGRSGVVVMPGPERLPHGFSGLGAAPCPSCRCNPCQCRLMRHNGRGFSPSESMGGWLDTVKEAVMPPASRPKGMVSTLLDVERSRKHIRGLALGIALGAAAGLAGALALRTSGAKTLALAAGGAAIGAGIATRIAPAPRAG